LRQNDLIAFRSFDQGLEFTKDYTSAFVDFQFGRTRIDAENIDRYFEWIFRYAQYIVLA